MKQQKFLNVILTLNAMLLVVLIWTHAGSGGGVVQNAAAQVDPLDAGSQRQRMIDAIQRMDKTVAETNKLLKGGKLKVRVANLADLKK